MPDWIVLKFGGTSVSSLERWETIAEIVRERLTEGFRPLVVCSALSGVSNALEKLLTDAVGGDYRPILAAIREQHIVLARELDLDVDALLDGYFEDLGRMALGASLVAEGSPRLRARLLAMGELMSTRLGAAFLQKKGLPTAWRDAREMLRTTDLNHLPEDRRFLSATCSFDADPALRAQLEASEADVWITQGFIAGTADGETALLGRGGSDTSAAYFASILEATRLEIWTDVPGMFTANPHEIPSARVLRRLDYLEAQELATMGAKVLHPRCIEPVRRSRIPLHIRCTQSPHLDHTMIADDVPDFGAQIKAISAKTGVTVISMDTLGMWQEVGFLARVFTTFQQHGVSIDLIATSETNVTVSLDPMANALDPSRVDALLRDLNEYCSARQIGPCAVVSLIGRNIRSILHEMGPTFEAFHEQHVYLVSQAASDLNFSFVVDEDQASRLVRKLHAQLFGRREADQLLGRTWKELTTDGESEMAGAQPWWRIRRRELIDLAVTSEATLYVYDEGTLRAAVDDLQSIDALDRIFYAMKANPHPEILRLFYEAGIGFECVSPGEMNRVRELFPEIEPERILFTPNFAGSDEYALSYDYGAYVTLDNLHPLETRPEIFEGKDLIIRVDPGRGHGHHKYVRTAGQQSKFGIEPDELTRLEVLVEAAGARIIGLHAHLGSGVTVPESWAETAVFLATLAERFPDVRILNIGGGLAVPERQGTPALDLSVVKASLARFKEAHPAFELWMEPGRYLVARAGVLLARVTQMKRKGAARYVGVETGMNSLLRPALYGAYHEIVNLTRLDDPVSITADVVGPICETGDVLGYGRRLPETEEGDVILIGTAGAYGRVMGSHYNLRAPADEVLLRSQTAEV